MAKAEFGVGERVNVPYSAKIQGVIVQCVGGVKIAHSYGLRWIDDEGDTKDQVWPEDVVRQANPTPRQKPDPSLGAFGERHAPGLRAAKAKPAAWTVPIEIESSMLRRIAVGGRDSTRSQPKRHKRKPTRKSKSKRRK